MEISVFDLESQSDESIPGETLSGCALPNDYDLESPQTVTSRSYDRETATWIREKAVAIHIPEEALAVPLLSGCVPASDYDLESPQIVTWRSYDRETETWIREKAVAIHIPEEALSVPLLSGCAPASDYDLESPQIVTCCAPASDYHLESPQTGTWRSYDRETETWIRKKAVAIHIPEESLVNPRLPPVVSIFRVPNFLKELKNRAYVPQIVSLGPYHSKRAKLSRMNDTKKRALRRMMTRFNDRYGFDSDNMEFSFRAIDQIFQDEEKIRNNYEEKIDCNPECLAVMLTLDGCFILEILRTLGGNKVSWEVSDNYEPIFERRKIDFTGFEILNDILKLENQIPLIVLRKLLQLELDSDNEADNFLFNVLVKTPGTKFYPFDYDMKDWSWPLPAQQVHHFLGLLHSLIVSPDSDDGDERANQIDNNGRKDNRRIPTAVELSNAGIKFKPRVGGIKKIDFNPKEATMSLPPINVADHTEVLFRNLVALELCKASGMNYVTCYLSLMDNLIDTEKDVALLRDSGIVKNYLGSDTEVAELFKGVTLPREYVFKKLQDDVMEFKKLQDDVMEHYRSKVKGWIAQFKENYFSSPWKFLALLGSIIALVLTLLQTIYAMK